MKDLPDEVAPTIVRCLSLAERNAFRSTSTAIDKKARKHLTFAESLTLCHPYSCRGDQIPWAGLRSLRQKFSFHGLRFLEIGASQIAFPFGEFVDLGEDGPEAGILELRNLIDDLPQTHLMLSCWSPDDRCIWRAEKLERMPGWCVCRRWRFGVSKGKEADVHPRVVLCSAGRELNNLPEELGWTRTYSMTAFNEFLNLPPGSYPFLRGCSIAHISAESDVVERFVKWFESSDLPLLSEITVCGFGDFSCRRVALHGDYWLPREIKIEYVTSTAQLVEPIIRAVKKKTGRKAL